MSIRNAIVTACLLAAPFAFAARNAPKPAPAAKGTRAKAAPKALAAKGAAGKPAKRAGFSEDTQTGLFMGLFDFERDVEAGRESWKSYGPHNDTFPPVDVKIDKTTYTVHMVSAGAFVGDRAPASAEVAHRAYIQDKQTGRYALIDIKRPMRGVLAGR